MKINVLQIGQLFTPALSGGVVILRKRSVSATRDGGAPRISARTRCFAVGPPVAVLPRRRGIESGITQLCPRRRGIRAASGLNVHSAVDKECLTCRV